MKASTVSFFKNWPFPTMWEEEKIPFGCVPTHEISSKFSWRETSVIKVYSLCFMILKTKTPFNTHQKQTKLPMEVWRASDFYPTLFLDGLEAAAFGGALALERSASSMAKEIRLQLGIWSGNFYFGRGWFGCILYGFGGWIFVGFTVFSMSEMCSGGWSDFSHSIVEEREIVWR